MTLLFLSQVADFGVGPLSLYFDRGLSFVTGDDPRTLALIAEVLVGVRRPRKGSALLDVASVYDSPKARSRIASLLPDERLPQAATVREALMLANELAQRTVDAVTCLEKFGLAHYADHSPAALSFETRRALGLAFALESARSSDVVLLFDPLEVAPSLPASAFERGLAELNSEAIVVVLSAHLEDALFFGGRAYLLERGVIAPYAALALPFGATLLVQSPEAPRLAELLERELGAAAVVFQRDLSASELRVRGTDLAELSICVTRVARDARIVVSALSNLCPSLDTLLRARARRPRARSSVRTA